jgi:hypothetical protein
MADAPDSPELHLTAHAENMRLERGIRRQWVGMTLLDPDWITPDPRPERMRAFKLIPEAGGKILRVVYEQAGDEYRVVTVFFDRNAKKP